MNIKEKTKLLSDKIDALYKIEHDEKKPSLERLDARTERLRLTRELNDLLTEACKLLD